MTLSQLEYFVGVAKTGHLTQSAKDFMIAQPSLTQAINKLESELGFPLFEKAGRRIFLTREGAQFLSYATEVVEAQRKAARAAAHIYQENKGRIRFAHTEPVPKNYIPDLIYHFLDKPENKGVRIESDVAGTLKIMEELRHDEIDFGFCSKADGDTPDLFLYPLFQRPIVLIASRHDPIAKMESVEPEDLMGRPCVSYGMNSAFDFQIRGFWDSFGIQPDVRYRSSAVAIGGMVARGLGWAFVALTDEIMREDIAVVNMPKMNLKRTMYLAVRANRKRGPAAERFQNYILSYSKQFQ